MLARPIPTIPTWATVSLWAPVVVGILMALCMGVMVISGNRAKDDQPLRAFALTAAVVLLCHAGYMLGPFAIGRSWWAWAFFLMLPLALLVAATAATPIYGAIRWTRPDGGSGWRTIAQMGWMSVFGVAVYLFPPLVLWMHRR